MSKRESSPGLAAQGSQTSSGDSGLAAAYRLGETARSGGFQEYVKSTCGSRRRQEIDRVDDRHGDDVFLGAEVKRAHAIDDLIGQQRRVHIRGMQLAK